MKFPTFAVLPDGTDAITSDPFTLKDGHVYFLVRAKIDSQADGVAEFAYALMRRDGAEWQTPYLSDGAMRILLAKRNGESPAESLEITGGTLAKLTTLVVVFVFALSSGCHSPTAPVEPPCFTYDTLWFRGMNGYMIVKSACGHPITIN